MDGRLGSGATLALLGVAIWLVAIVVGSVINEDGFPIYSLPIPLGVAIFIGVGLARGTKPWPMIATVLGGFLALIVTAALAYYATAGFDGGSDLLGWTAMAVIVGATYLMFIGSAMAVRQAPGREAAGGQAGEPADGTAEPR
jgi:hypothetical protein